MRMHRWIVTLAVLAAGLAASSRLHAQGVTTATLAGQVTRVDGSPLFGGRVTAVHEPSGTTYQGITRSDGRYTIPGMRVGGPYTVTVRAIGIAPQSRSGITLNLGVATDISFEVRDVATTIGAVVVTGETGTLSPTRTGAATTVGSEALETLPTISRNIGDFTRLTPQSSGTSFAGQDNRMNNITIDGSYFNNSFGLAGTPGARTGVSPIPLDAVEQIQVAIAPFDVRQGNFVGAGVNAVTKSGTNNFEGSLYYLTRNEDFVGTDAGDLPFDPGTFKFSQFGARLGGPILRNKLFFFANFEDDGLTNPATTFLANAGGEEVEGNTTRVLASDLDSLSAFLRTNFDYETGAYSGYNHKTPSRRLITKVDFNANESNKLSLRYIHLDSKTDQLVSNSSSLGFGNRRTNSNSLSFANSDYAILENIRSLVGEWNSQVRSNISNNFIVGYTTNDESREPKGQFFPLVDILEAGRTYTSFGFEPFTPNNELRYNTFQIQDNLTWYTTNHDITIGATLQRYKSENVFFSGSQSVYIYNSLDDFYTDANDYLANPNRTVSPVTLNRFQVRYNNIPGQVKPIQPLEVMYGGVYAQDEWRATDNLRLTLGLRLDVPKFGNTALRNPDVEELTFRDEKGADVQYATDKLPDANVLFSPRLGINWNVRGDRTTQIRGGTGIFTGSPAYVWISNQVGENGILTGFEDIRNTTARPFNPNPDTYKPTTVTGAPASSYGLAFTDPDFMFPQVWRSNLALDQRLPFGVIGTLEFLYGQDVNGAYYINANLAEPTDTFTGADDRPRWTASNRINSNITSAIVLKNQNVGRSYDISGSLERSFSNGFFAKAAYNYGVSRNTVDPGSIAFGSWNNNAHAGDPNNPGVGFSASSPGHRGFLALSYRREYFDFGATSVSLFAETRTQGNASYTFSGDLNGDGGTSNDLIYVPRDVSEMNFETYTVPASGTIPARTYTAEDQAAAWEAFIEQDPYLSKRRGKYAERGAVFLPMVFRTDLSLAQDLFTSLRGKRNNLQLRVDILNFLNLLNDEWGTGDRLVTTQPLVARGADATGAALYRLQTINREFITDTFEQTAGIGDVWRLQFGIRYTFQ